MGLFNFFQGNKKTKESNEIDANNINLEQKIKEKYIKQISNLSGSMPIAHIIVKFSTNNLKDFPVDVILDELSTETTKNGDGKIFTFKDSSKIIKTEHSVNLLRSSRAPEGVAAEKMSKIVGNANNLKPIHSLLENKVFVDELEKPVKQEKKKRNSRFSMR